MAWKDSKEGKLWRSKYIKKYMKEYNKDKRAAWYEKNIEKHNQQGRDNYIKRKQAWYDFIQDIGMNHCSICGYDECFAAIEFHHINPEEKEVDINVLTKGAFTAENVFKFLEETNKCIVVCANCHRKIHN